jgi:hypothetical protein
MGTVRVSAAAAVGTVRDWVLFEAPLHATGSAPQLSSVSRMRMSGLRLRLAALSSLRQRGESKYPCVRSEHEHVDVGVSSEGERW